jgi:hypothetical protein
MKRVIGRALLASAGVAIGRALLAAAGVAGTAAVGAGVAKWLVSRNGGVIGDRAPHNRWLMVTINCPPQAFPTAGNLPEPVRKLTGMAEVMTRIAPGDRGTELGMRLREQPSPVATGLAARIAGDDPRQQIRAALRDAKSMIEAGEVLRPDEPTTHPTPAGKVLDFAAKRAYGEGRP